MVTVGIDAIEIERCNEWANYSEKKLRRIFSKEEIAYCLSNRLKSAERFAVRFAAKEALYKALKKKVPLLRLFAHSELTKNPEPTLIVNWQALGIKPYTLEVSLTHTSKMAIAVVIGQ